MDTSASTEVVMSTPKRGTSIEKENPFRPGGEIRKEVDDLLRSSTISADRITIVDPSSPQYRKSNGGVSEPPSDEILNDNNEQVLISVNTTTKDDNDNEQYVKHRLSTIESNGHTPEEVDSGRDNGRTLEEVSAEKDKSKVKKKKSKKTCEIL